MASIEREVRKSIQGSILDMEEAVRPCEKMRLLSIENRMFRDTQSAREQGDWGGMGNKAEMVLVIER